MFSIAANVQALKRLGNAIPSPMAYRHWTKLQKIMIYSTAVQNSFSRNWCRDIWCSWRILFLSHNRCNAML